MRRHHHAQAFLKRQGYADGGGIADEKTKKAATVALQQAQQRAPSPSAGKSGDFVQGLKDAAGFFLTRDPQLTVGSGR